MDTGYNTEEPKFGNNWEVFDEDNDEKDLEVRATSITFTDRLSMTNQISVTEARKSKFLDDLNWFKDISDETNKQLTEPETDDKVEMYDTESIIGNPKVRQNIGESDTKTETEKIELETFDDFFKERIITRDSNIFDSKKTNTKEWEIFETIVDERDVNVKSDSTKPQNKTDTEKVPVSEHSQEAYSNIRLQGVTLQGIYNVKKNEEKSICEISDICQFTDDITLVVDEKNKSVKKLGVNYYITAHVILPDAPFGICKVDKKEVAITLGTKKKVQMISVKNKMTLKKYFKVKDICRGITHYEGLFYICCGGSPTIDHDGFESHGHVGVYSITGTYLSKYRRGILSPRYVCLNHDSTKLFVTDHYNGVIVLDLDGRLVSQINMDASTKPCGICCLKEGLLCLSNHQRNEVVSFDETGVFNLVLLQRKEGLVAPRAICYDFRRARLLVSSMWSDDTIKVFNLHLTKHNM